MPQSALAEIQARLASPSAAAPFLWTNPGPVNPIGGWLGRSGKLQAFAWEPSLPNIMYAGGGLGAGAQGPYTEAGAFKTVDGGITWTSINQGLLDTTVNVLWVDRSNPGVLLAGTAFGGIFRTADGGQSWIQVSKDAPVSELVTVPGGVLAATGRGFEFSGDSGATWSLQQSTSAAVRCLAVSATDMIAGLDNGDVLWKGVSDRTWRAVASNATRLDVWDVAIDPVDSSVAYYLENHGDRRTVQRTRDKGSSWQLITPPIGIFAQALAVLPSDRSVLVAGQGMFFRSLDFGATWQTLSAPWDDRKIILIPNSPSLVMGSDHGLHWTDNLGQTWRDLTPAISSNILYSVAVSGQTILTSSQDFGPFLSSNGGKTWWTPSGPLGEGGGVAINPGDPAFCYAFTQSDFAVSTDHCLTFKAVTGPKTQYYNPPNSPGENPNQIAVDPHNPSSVYIAAFDGVWQSTDWGLTLRHLGWPMDKVLSIAFDQMDPLAMYVSAVSGLYRSLDGGVTWTALRLPTTSPPYVAAVSPFDSNVVLVALASGAGRGTDGGVLRSTNRGASFSFVNQGLPTALLGIGDQVSLAFNPAPVSPGALPVVVLATSSGAFVSADLGNAWQGIRSNANTRAFTYLRWDKDGYLWASTYGQGVLRSDQPISGATFSSASSALKVTGGPIWFTNIMGLSPISGSQTLQVTTAGAAQNLTVAVAQSPGACGNWLSADTLAGTTTGAATGFPIKVSYSVAALPPDTSATCDGAITVTSAGATVSIPVTIQIMQLLQSRLQKWNLAFTESPMDLISMSMVFDSRRHVGVMFGGRDNTAVYSNTYQYTPTGWNRISTLNSPPARFWSAMAYDDHRQRIVLFGGQTNTTAFGDTWEFDGANWTPVSTVHSPGAQSSTSMTYDSCRQKTVLFDSRGRTWEYDGTDWTNVTTSASPSVRRLAAMVFDAGHCRALLFGGEPNSASSKALSDTWSYDGTNWTHPNTTATPPGRWGHVMAFDTSRGRIVLFGGYGPVDPAATDTNDTWEFDGATWVQVFPQASPPSLVQAAMLYDESRSRIVMFGATQAWEYTPGPVWAVATTHARTFSQGQTGATYTVTVANTVWTDQTSGTVTVRETMPPGLTLVSMSGAGWTCTPGSPSCTRTDPLAAGASYPPLTVTVNVAADAPTWVTNSVSVSGSGLVTAAATDLTSITPAVSVGPQISPGGIVNAATSRSGGIAPNEFISLIGAGLGPATGVGSAMTLQLAGTSVSIGGTPAYLTYAQDAQINVLVPFNVSGLQNTTIQVRYSGVAGNSVTVPVVPSSPGIFTQQYGPGQVWMANQDGTFNSSSNPAKRNSYVTFWVTGQGAVNMPLPDGTQPSGPPYPTPILPVSVSLGGVAVPAANIAFDGLVYSGEMQINLLIPADAPTGSAVPLVVVIGAASSQTDATIAVR